MWIWRTGPLTEWLPLSFPDIERARTEAVDNRKREHAPRMFLNERTKAEAQEVLNIFPRPKPNPIP